MSGARYTPLTALVGVLVEGGDHSPLTTPRQPLRSFYIAERAARAREFWLSLLVFSQSLCICFVPLLVSTGALLSSLPALCISSLPALSVSSLPVLCSLSSRLWSLLSSLPAFCSLSAGAQFSSLLRSCLISASAPPLARRVMLNHSSHMHYWRLKQVTRGFHTGRRRVRNGLEEYI